MKKISQLISKAKGPLEEIRFIRCSNIFFHLLQLYKTVKSRLHTTVSEENRLLYHPFLILHIIRNPERQNHIDFSKNTSMFQKERLQDIKDLFYFLEKKINKNIV